MSNVDERFALVNPVNGDVFFPYQKSRKEPKAYGFALSKPAEGDRQGHGIYTTDICEVIRQVVINGLKVKSQTKLGRRDGSRGILLREKLIYWVAPEFLYLVKDALTQPLATLPTDRAASIFLSCE